MSSNGACLTETMICDKLCDITGHHSAVRTPLCALGDVCRRGGRSVRNHYNSKTLHRGIHLKSALFT